MELSGRIDVMVKIASERYPSKSLEIWARRFLLGIDKTEKSFDVAFSSLFRTPKFPHMEKWLEVFVAVRAWFDSIRPDRSDKFKMQGLTTCENYTNKFFVDESIPSEHYKL